MAEYQSKPCFGLKTPNNGIFESTLRLRVVYEVLYRIRNIFALRRIVCPFTGKFKNIFGSVQMKLNLFNLFIKIELCTDETEFN